MLKELLNSIENKYKEKKYENNTLNNLLETTSTFETLKPIPKLQNDYSEYKVAYITNNCPDINEDKAKRISKLIPLEETYLSILYIKEIKTNQEFYLIPTTKYLWLINTKNYVVYYYNNLSCTIIKNNLMSKILLLNNILIEVNGTDLKIKEFIQLINNTEYRNQLIKQKSSYLCEIIPTYQKINEIGSGISIDNNKNIVFHTKEKNYKYTYDQIDNYEIMLDSQIYASKKNNLSKTIGSFQNSCYQMSIRITTKNNQILILPILPPNNFGTKYEGHSSIYIKNLKFANSILNKLNEIIPKY